MKKYPKVALTVLFLTTLIIFSGCGEDEKLPSNVIEDSEGIKVDLDWSTGGTPTDALNDTDLDLRIYKGGAKVLWSETGSQFERIEFDPDLYADGVYTVVIYLFSTDENVSYTATINGINVSKPYEFNSTFGAEDESREVSAVTITKKGNKYTIKPVD